MANVAFAEGQKYVRAGSPSPGELFSLSCPQTTANRRVYFYITFITSAAPPPAANVFEGYLELRRSGMPVGAIPINVSSADVLPNKGAFCLPASGGNPTENSGILTLPFSIAGGATTVALHALSLSSDFDSIGVICSRMDDDAGTVTGYFAYVACLSY